MADKEQKHYNCAWCGTSLGYHAHDWEAVQEHGHCPRCQKALWTTYDNRSSLQVFAAPPCVGQRVLS